MNGAVGLGELELIETLVPLSILTPAERLLGVKADPRPISRLKPWGWSIFQPKGDPTMRFMMLVKATKDFEVGVWPDEKLLSEMAKWTEELVKAGARLEAGRLQPSSKGVRVRYSDGKFMMTDGPFAES